MVLGWSAIYIYHLRPLDYDLVAPLATDLASHVLCSHLGSTLYVNDLRTEQMSPHEHSYSNIATCRDDYLWTIFQPKSEALSKQLQVSAHVRPSGQSLFRFYQILTLVGKTHCKLQGFDILKTWEVLRNSFVVCNNNCIIFPKQAFQRHHLRKMTTFIAGIHYIILQECHILCYRIYTVNYSFSRRNAIPSI